MGKSIFLCYRLTDSDMVERIKSDFAKSGLDAWSYSDVLPGQSWRSLMNQALVEAETVIVLLSPSFIENEVCRQQVYIAQALQKRIIPIMLCACYDLLDSADEFSQLKGLNIIPSVSGKIAALEDDYETLFAQLLDAVLPNHNPTPLNAQHNYIAFSRLDTDFVTQLSRDLNEAGIYTWSTATHLRGGDNWRRGIAEAVLTASNLILVLSLDSIESYWVRREVLLAQLRGIPILPFISPRVLEGSSYGQEYPKIRDAAAMVYEMNLIREINWIYPEPDYDKALYDLVTVLKGVQQEKSRKQGIFISYRRADSRDVTDRVYDYLVEEFGTDTIFQDVGSIPAGKNFVDVLTNALDKAAVMLVIIGSHWASITDEVGNKRLHNPDDLVRIEVQAALEHEDMVVIPVLLDTTPMPTINDLPESLRDLHFRQSIRLRPNPDFRRDMNKLVAQIRESQQ